MGLARCRLGNEGQGCQVVDGMIVPQPRDKTWGRTELGREVLKFCMEWASRVRGCGEGHHSPVTWGESEECYFTEWECGQGRRIGLGCPEA